MDRVTHNLCLGRHCPHVVRFRPGDVDNSIVRPGKREQRTVRLVHDELFIQLMVQAQMMIAVDFQEAPEFVA